MSQPHIVEEWPVTVMRQQSAAWLGFRAAALRVRHDRPSAFVRMLPVHSLFFNLGARPVQMESRIEGGPVRRTPLAGHAWTLVPAGTTLRGVINQTPAFEHLSIQFEDAQWRGTLAEAGVDCAGLDLLPRLGAGDPLVNETARRLRRALDLDGAIGHLYGAQLGAVLMTELAMHHSSRPAAGMPARGGLGAGALRRVLDALNDAGGPPDAAALVMLSGVSRSHFFRAFKQSTGLSPERYLTERRVTRAKDLLALDPAIPLAAVAAAAGFASLRHLLSAFRRVTGRPLTAFRSELG